MANPEYRMGKLSGVIPYWILPASVIRKPRMAAVGHERHQRIRPDLNEQRAGYGNKQSAYSERNHQEIADKFVQASGALKGRVENGRFKMVPFQNKKNAYAQYHGKDI